MAKRGNPQALETPYLSRARYERAGVIGAENLTESIRASGSNAAQTGRTHDHTPNPPTQILQKPLAKQEPSTHDISFLVCKPEKNEIIIPTKFTNPD